MGLWSSGRAALARYLASPDPLAAAANAGAFLVWSNQPFYPLYCWLIAGDAAWPSVLTWLSTPFFCAVAPTSRTHPLAARVLFCVAGVLNTLLAAKAMGVATRVGWFLVPCLVLPLGYFRPREWRVAAPLAVAVLGAAFLLPLLGAPVRDYDAETARALGRLNIWSVTVLSAYLAYAAVRARAISAEKRGP